MGTIAETLRELKPKYDKLIDLSNKINTRRLQEELLESVFGCFHSLRPLSYKYQELPQDKFKLPQDKFKSSSSYYSLTIGTWIGKKWRYQKYGSSISYEREFFDIIRKYGSDLVKYLRRPIKDDFTKLTDLTKQTKSYDETAVSIVLTAPRKIMDYSFPYCPRGYYGFRSETTPIEGKMKLETKIIKGLGVGTHKPLEVILHETIGNETLSINSESNVAVLEDIIDDALKLYRKADSIVGKLRQHNEAIMEQMKTIAIPWKLGKEMKK